MPITIQPKQPSVSSTTSQKSEYVRLIATLGATTPKAKHKYQIDNDSYEAYFSFLALQQRYNPSETIIIGTEETKSILDEFNIFADDTITFEEVSKSDNGNYDEESLYRKAVEIMDIPGSIILDVTQGYRSFPMLTVLASIFIQHLQKKDRTIKEIYYAQTVDSNCIPGRQQCVFEFVSLLRYVDMANLGEMIQNFVHSLSVPYYQVGYSEHIPLISKLQHLSRLLAKNDMNASIAYAHKIVPEMKTLKGVLPHMETSLKALGDIIGQLINIEKYNRNSKRLYVFSKLMYKKNHHLRAVTLFYEALTEYVYEYVKQKSLSAYFKDQHGNGCLKQSNGYTIKNCLKKSLRNAVSNLGMDNESRKHLSEISDLLFVLDHVRNQAAHAFLQNYRTKKVTKSMKNLSFQEGWSFDKLLDEIFKITDKFIKI